MLIIYPSSPKDLSMATSLYSQKEMATGQDNTFFDNGNKCDAMSKEIEYDSH